jgi:hypothetical protein
VRPALLAGDLGLEQVEMLPRRIGSDPREARLGDGRLSADLSELGDVGVLPVHEGNYPAGVHEPEGALAHRDPLQRDPFGGDRNRHPPYEIRRGSLRGRRYSECTALAQELH